MIRIVLADDQPLIRAGFAVFIRTAPDLEVVGEAATGHEAVTLARATRPDVVLMDIRMPDLDGLSATRAITSDPTLPHTRVLILTTFEVDEYVYAALEAGAGGFLGKGTEPSHLLDAIRTIHKGEALLSPAATRTLITHYLTHPASHSRTPALQSLTDREREVLVLVATGLSNDEIAAHLHLSPHTIKTHINRAMLKLDAHDRAQLVIAAYKSGLIS
jgi:DNA-binding NarL/FixJ family response regulator